MINNKTNTYLSISNKQKNNKKHQKKLLLLLNVSERKGNYREKYE